MLSSSNLFQLPNDKYLIPSFPILHLPVLKNTFTDIQVLKIKYIDFN